MDFIITQRGPARYLDPFAENRIHPTSNLRCDRTKILATKHVKDAARGAHHDVGCLGLKLGGLIAHVGPTDAGVTASAHVVAKGQDHLLDL